MLSLAAEKQIISSSPRFELAKEVRRERLIDSNEEALILAKGNPTVRDVFMLVMDTGIRPGEAAALAWSSVDLIHRSIQVIEGKTKNARRKLPMTTRVLEMLKARAALSEQWVFPGRKGHIAARSVIGMFSQLKNEIGLPADLVLYSARHTFATDFQEAFGDLTKTSKQLGHGATAITERYVHAKTSDTATAMDERNRARLIGHTPSHTSREMLQ